MPIQKCVSSRSYSLQSGRKSKKINPRENMRKISHLLLFMFCMVFLNCHSLSSSCCKVPERGLPGPVGPTGPQGPASLGTFASLSLHNVPQTVNPGAAVIFAETDVLEGSISYNSITGTITLNNPGFYMVTYGFTATTNNRQFLLQLNGVNISGSSCDSATSNLQGLSVTFQTTLPLSTLQLINNSGIATILQTTTPGSEEAFIVVQQIQ
jgi:hypothetical protein